MFSHLCLLIKNILTNFVPHNINNNNHYSLKPNDYEEILNTNFMSYISNYKLNFNPELYKKIIEKYNEYKKFIE